MGKESGGGGEIADVSSSPKGRVKFLCSYGGKIMPRPNDGHLKYIGGETRVIVVPRDITYSGLMKKLCTEFEGEMVLKYQILPEDLDVLVSVRADEDLKHMLDEYDRYDTKGSIKFRTFLFPVNPVATENQIPSLGPFMIEQRAAPSVKLRPINANQPIFIFSPGSSPQSKSSSPDSNNVDSMYIEPTFVNSYHNTDLLSLTKVKSSPNLSSFNNTQNSQGSNNHNNNHTLYQHFQHYHHHPQQPHQPHQQYNHHGYQNFRPSHDSRRLSPCSSVRRPDPGKTPNITSGIYFFSGHNAASGSSKHRLHDDRSIYSLPPSPKQRGFLE